MTRSFFSIGCLCFAFFLSFPTFLSQAGGDPLLIHETRPLRQEEWNAFDAFFLDPSYQKLWQNSGSFLDPEAIQDFLFKFQENYKLLESSTHSPNKFKKILLLQKKREFLTQFARFKALEMQVIENNLHKKTSPLEKECGFFFKKDSFETLKLKYPFWFSGTHQLNQFVLSLFLQESKELIPSNTYSLSDYPGVTEGFFFYRDSSQSFQCIPLLRAEKSSEPYLLMSHTDFSNLHESGYRPAVVSLQNHLEERSGLFIELIQGNQGVVDLKVTHLRGLQDGDHPFHKSLTLNTFLQTDDLEGRDDIIPLLFGAPLKKLPVKATRFFAFPEKEIDWIFSKVEFLETLDPREFPDLDLPRQLEALEQKALEFFLPEASHLIRAEQEARSLAVQKQEIEGMRGPKKGRKGGGGAKKPNNKPPKKEEASEELPLLSEEERVLEIRSRAEILMQDYRVEHKIRYQDLLKRIYEIQSIVSTSQHFQQNRRGSHLVFHFQNGTRPLTLVEPHRGDELFLRPQQANEKLAHFIRGLLPVTQREGGTRAPISSVSGASAKPAE